MASQHTNAQTNRYSLVVILSFFILSLLEGGCMARKIRDAEFAHNAGRYSEAAELYRTLYQKQNRKEREKKAFFAFRAAENYRQMRYIQRAKSFYVSARTYQYPDSIVSLRIAEMDLRLGHVRDALKGYDAFLELYPQDYFAHIGREKCLRRDTLRTNPFHYQVRPVRALNSSRSDFGGAFLPDGSAFYYSSARSKNPEIVNSTITGEKPNDLFFIRQDAQGHWSRPDSVAGGVNTPHDEGMPAISSDGNTLYYTSAESNDLYDRTAKIYSSSKSGEGGWSAGREVAIWTDSLRMAAHPSWSSSGQRLYFVSEGGYGGKDIYYIDKEGIGSALPTNIGGEINTPGNEITPFAVGDSTLYFASDGHIGLGGYDLYRADLLPSGSWRCVHLGAPINSESDDYALVLSPKPDRNNTSEGYFSSSRQDALGHPHLWSFYQPAIKTQLEGVVSDRDGNPISGAIIRVVSESNPEVPLLATSRTDGYYSLDIEGGTRYVLLVGASGFLRSYASFVTDPATEDLFYTIDFQLASSDRVEVFHDIFYDFDRADLLPESQKTLDEIVKILQDNPDIVVELAAHADRKGPDAYNVALSLRRAESVVNYLVEKGIAKERLFSKGYGKSQPRIVSSGLHTQHPNLPEGAMLSEEFIETLSETDQAIADSLNRRTEFKVLDKGKTEESLLSEDQEPRTDWVAPLAE